MKIRVARLVIVSLLAFGLAAGFLPLSATPAKALVKNSLLGTNGSPTEFFGLDAVSYTNAGSYRVGKAPFTIVAETTGAGWSGSFPLTFSYVWGDGASNVSTQACFGCNVLPGVGGIALPNLAIAMHTYNVAGNYNLIVNLSDNLGNFRSDSYPVQVYSVNPVFAVKWRAFIEGQGLVANLSRQTSLGQPIMAFIYNNATYPIIKPTVVWYEDSWANPIYSQSFAQTVFPGGYFPMVWPGNIPIVVTAPGTHQFWVKTSCFGCSANVTSAKMTVIYTNAIVAPSITATITSGAISNLQPGQTAIVKYLISNPSSFTINWLDQVSLINNLFVVPDPPTLALQFGPVINNTVQVYILQPAVSVGTAPPATDQGNYPFTNLGYLLAPGQSVVITQEINNPSVTQTAFSGGLQVSFIPYIAASCTAPTTGASASCAFGGNPTFATTTITVGGPAPASITTSYGQQIGNGSVVFAGTVNSMGSATVMQAWFQFTVPNGTTYTTAQHLVTAVGVVQDYEQNLPVGNNYTLTFLALTSLGQSLNGGTVTFIVGLNVPSNSPTADGQGFTQNMLFAFAQSAGIPAVILGAIVGMAVIVVGVIMFLALDVRNTTFLMMWLLIATVLNVWLFLWPSVILLLIIVPEAIMIYEKFAHGTGGEEEVGG